MDSRSKHGGQSNRAASKKVFKAIHKPERLIVDSRAQCILPKATLGTSLKGWVAAARGAGSQRRCDRRVAGLPTIEHMAIKKMEHVGIVVNDLATAIEFFVELGLEPGGKGQVEGEWVDRIIALDGTKAELAMLQTPDGHGEIELVKFHSPPTQGGDPHAPSNTPGLRHLSFLVDDIDVVVAGLRARGTDLVGELVRYENSYRLCYVRGPEGIIIELAEKIS
jgi:catechol 2,3-dioxygenase-like lactoylglutathione lyase family enzyme